MLDNRRLKMFERKIHNRVFNVEPSDFKFVTKHSRRLRKSKFLIRGASNKNNIININMDALDDNDVTTIINTILSSSSNITHDKEIIDNTFKSTITIEDGDFKSLTDQQKTNLESELKTYYATHLDINEDLILIDILSGSIKIEVTIKDVQSKSKHIEKIYIKSNVTDFKFYKDNNLSNMYEELILNTNMIYEFIGADIVGTNKFNISTNTGGSIDNDKVLLSTTSGISNGESLRLEIKDDSDPLTLYYYNSDLSPVDYNEIDLFKSKRFHIDVVKLFRSSEDEFSKFTFMYPDNSFLIASKNKVWKYKSNFEEDIDYTHIEDITQIDANSELIIISSSGVNTNGKVTLFNKYFQKLNEYEGENSEDMLGYSISVSEKYFVITPKVKNIIQVYTTTGNKSHFQIIELKNEHDVAFDFSDTTQFDGVGKNEMNCKIYDNEQNNITYLVIAPLTSVINEVFIYIKKPMNNDFELKQKLSTTDGSRFGERIHFTKSYLFIQLDKKIIIYKLNYSNNMYEEKTSISNVESIDYFNVYEYSNNDVKIYISFIKDTSENISIYQKVTDTLWKDKGTLLMELGTGLTFHGDDGVNLDNYGKYLSINKNVLLVSASNEKKAFLYKINNI